MVKKQTALIVILILAVAGLIFSGYLSYSELFNQVCPLGSCPSVSGIPACIYGFAMYLIILIITLIGLRGK